MQLVCIVVPRVVGNPQIFHQCNALIEHLPPVILMKGLSMLVVIRSEFGDVSNSSKNFTPIVINPISQS
jgi:hypothetical protein